MISRDESEGKDILLHSNELKLQETYSFLLLVFCMSENVPGEKYSIDFIPNQIKQGITRFAEDALKDRFERKLPRCIARWGKLSAETIQVKPFELLFRQARFLYIDGYFEAVVALCGMTVEALCISIAEDRVPKGKLKNKLTNPKNWVRNKIKPLKKYFKGDYSASLLGGVLDIRKKYVHFHKMRVDQNDVLQCVNKLHLVLIAEYGLIPEGGRFRLSTKEDVEESARHMEITL